jgi:spermidine/putrescine transport system ATP-binding protein
MPALPGVTLNESKGGNQEKLNNNSYDVELHNIIKRFDKTVAVHDVSLQINAGEFITLLGPSGCGKTTLLRIIAGFEKPDSGRVILCGEEVTDVPPYRRNVTTVFQQYALFPHLSVFQNIAFGLERRRLNRETIKQRGAEALDMVRLTGLDERKPNELSGGQQQRVALARALVLQPKVLLLDEPLAALDLKLRKQMQAELKSLQRRLGISFVFVTHDQEEALTMSDRVVVMNGGRIEQLGLPQEIYERPRSEFVAAFIGDSNIIEGTVESSDERFITVQSSGSNFSIPGNSVVVGEKVKIMVRPEKIKLSQYSESAVANGNLSGKVESAMYLGESTQWKVVLIGGQIITVLEQNHDSSAAIESRIGQAVTLSWEPDSAVLLQQ